MRVTIEINCDNAAFDDDNATDEVGRILRELADDDRLTEIIVAGQGQFDIRDINGNTVGKFVVK